MTASAIPTDLSAALIVDDEADERQKWTAALNGRMGFEATAVHPQSLPGNTAGLDVLLSDVIDSATGNNVRDAERRVQTFKTAVPDGLGGFLTYYPERAADANLEGDCIISKKDTPTDDLAPLLRRVRQLQAAWALGATPSSRAASSARDGLIPRIDFLLANLVPRVGLPGLLAMEPAHRRARTPPWAVRRPTCSVAQTTSPRSPGQLR